MQMTLHRASRYALSFAALLGAPYGAHGQAFGLNEIGSCALARGFAVTSAPCADPSSIYWNPGAMPAAQGLSFLGGGAFIKIDGDFTRDTSFRVYKADVPTSFVPHVFLNYPAGDLAYGIGLYVPYGLTSQCGDDFPGRFAAKKASLHTIYVQPNISYQINPDWSIGGGPVIAHSPIDPVHAIDLSGQLPVPAAGLTFGNLRSPKYTESARPTPQGTATGYGRKL